MRSNSFSVQGARLGLGVRTYLRNMGYIIVVSVPAVLIILIIALACCLIGREYGRRRAAWVPQNYGPTAPPYQHREKPPEV